MAGAAPAAEPKKGGKTALGLRKRKRVGIGVDMTPMVDVAFLLLIFFMVTTVFRRPLAMEVNMPQPGATVQVPETNVMTVFIGRDNQMSYKLGRTALAPIAWEQLESSFKANAAA